MITSYPERSWRVIAAALALGVVGISSAQAALQFSDGFAYAAGALGGDGPPAGAPAGQTAWTTVNGSTQVTAGSLTYPGGIPTTGNKATVTGVSGNNGDISTDTFSTVGGGSGTEWVGFLINEGSGGSTPGGFGVLSLSENGGIGTAFGALFNRNVYGIDNDTADVEQASTGIGVSGATHLFVAELNYSTGMTYLFVDPSGTPNIASANASLAMTPAFKASGFDEVVLAAGFNTASFNIDTIKVGSTFADVVPEPSAASLLAVAVTGSAAWGGLRRRRRQDGAAAR